MVPDIQKGIQSFWKIKNIPTIRYCLLYSVYCTVVLRGFNSTLLERPNKKLNYLWFQWIDYYENITIHVDEEENIFFFFKKRLVVICSGDDYPIYGSVPDTSFLCDGLVDGGYYADPEAQCQVYHHMGCLINNGIPMLYTNCKYITVFICQAQSLYSIVFCPRNDTKNSFFGAKKIISPFLCKD